MKLFFQITFLTIFWTQLNMTDVTGWHVWRINMQDGTMTVEATVNEPKYNIPQASASAYYTISSFNSAGDSFVIWTTNKPETK